MSATEATPATIGVSAFAKPGLFGRVKTTDQPQLLALHKESDEAPAESFFPRRRETSNTVNIMRQGSIGDIAGTYGARAATYQFDPIDESRLPTPFEAIAPISQDVEPPDSNDFCLNDSEVEDEGGVFHEPILFDMESLDLLKNLSQQAPQDQSVQGSARYTPRSTPRDLATGTQLADDFDEFDNCLGSSEVSENDVGNEDLMQLLQFTPVEPEDMMSTTSVEVPDHGEEEDVVSTFGEERPPMRRSEIEERMDVLEMGIARVELDLSLTQEYGQHMHADRLQERLATLTEIWAEVASLRVHPVKLSDENQKTVESFGGVVQEHMNLLTETYLLAKKVAQAEEGIARLKANNAVLRERLGRDRGAELADMIHTLEDDLQMKRLQTSERLKEMERDLADQDVEIRSMLYEIETRKMERRRQKRLACRYVAPRAQK